MLRFQGIRPHLTSNYPRRKKLFKAGRFNVPRNIMRPPNVIHIYSPGACLSTWCTTTLGTATIAPSLNGTSPHADTLNPNATVHTTTRSSLTETLLGRRTHPLKFLLEPPHVTYDRRWPLLTKRRLVRNGNGRLWHISHVDNSDIVKILIQTPRIRNQNPYTADILTLWNTAFHSIRPTTG